MSSVNYSLNHKGVRVVDAKDAWTKDKNGKLRLNPKYNFVGKVDTNLPNMIITASDKRQPAYKGDVSDLSRVAKDEMVKHFYNENGKRNRKSVAYLAIQKDAGSASSGSTRKPSSKSKTAVSPKGGKKR